MNNNMNDAPTKEELLAAGATQLDERKIYYWDLNLMRLACSVSRLEAFLSISKIGENAVVWGKESATKQDVQDAHKLLFGKELDFTPKENTYSWDDVFSPLDSSLKMSIHNVLLTIAASSIPAQIRAKLTALVKLEYIIKAIEADCVADYEKDYRAFIDQNGKINYYGVNYEERHKSSPILANSEEAIRTLIKHHPDLIKDALGVEY